MTNSLSTSKRQPLPRAWVEKISSVMLMTYGKRFTDLWGATNPDAWVTHWAEALSGYSGDELARGLGALGGSEWPPTLPEFKRMCRPPIDPQTAFYEAVEGVQARERGEVGTWSHPAIFWAAVKVGAFDIKSAGWAQMQRRWETALQAILDAGDWQPIPAPALALPAPGKAVLSREKASALLAELGAASVLRPTADPRAWIERVRERQRAGEAVPLAVAKLADEAERV